MDLFPDDSTMCNDYFVVYLFVVFPLGCELHEGETMSYLVTIVPQILAQSLTHIFFLKNSFIHLFLAALGRCGALWLLLLRSTGSRCAGFSSCSTRAQ